MQHVLFPVISKDDNFTLYDENIIQRVIYFAVDESI
jgi:hypothetical protein